MRVFLGLGSNIDSEHNLRCAAGLLRTIWPQIRFSAVYRSTPVGPVDQPDFLNAVATIIAEQPPQVVHDRLAAIERQLGKQVAVRFGPRTIDLDILLYGDAVIDESGLHVPHPRMHERRFVLEPLCALINASAKHPIMKKTWAELLASVQNQHCEKIRLIL